MKREKLHSPLPWESKASSMLVVDPYDNVVADCQTETFESERFANAEMIALACNNHYRLVEALSRLSEVAAVTCNLGRSNFAIRADVWNEMHAATDAARVALDKLEENSESASSIN